MQSMESDPTGKVDIMDSNTQQRPRQYPKGIADPMAGLRQRRQQRGLPTGPVEWWQAIELETVAKVARLRARGVC